MTIILNSSGVSFWKLPLKCALHLPVAYILFYLPIFFTNLQYTGPSWFPSDCYSSLSLFTWPPVWNLGRVLV